MNSATNKLWHLSHNNNNFMLARGIHVFVPLIFEQKTKPKKGWRKRIGNQLPMLWKVLQIPWLLCTGSDLHVAFSGGIINHTGNWKKKIENTEWLSGLYGFTEVGLEDCIFFFQFFFRRKRKKKLWLVIF